MNVRGSLDKHLQSKSHQNKVNIYTCKSCNKTMKHTSKYKHEKSKLHLNNINKDNTMSVINDIVEEIDIEMEYQQKELNCIDRIKKETWNMINNSDLNNKEQVYNDLINTKDYINNHVNDLMMNDKIDYEYKKKVIEINQSSTVIDRLYDYYNNHHIKYECTDYEKGYEFFKKTGTVAIFMELLMIKFKHVLDNEIIINNINNDKWLKSLIKTNKNFARNVCTRILEIIKDYNLTHLIDNIKPFNRIIVLITKSDE